MGVGARMDIFFPRNVYFLIKENIFCITYVIRIYLLNLINNLFTFHHNTWHLILHHVRLHLGLVFQRQIESQETELLIHKT